jgi:hypothetical protein
LWEKVVRDVRGCGGRMEVQEGKEARSRRGEFARHSTIIGGAMAKLSGGSVKKKKKSMGYFRGIK